MTTSNNIFFLLCHLNYAPLLAKFSLFVMDTVILIYSATCLLNIWLVYGQADIALWVKVPNSEFRLNLYPYIVYASS